MNQRVASPDESLPTELAAVVRARSKAEEEHWGIGDPVPLRVRWHEAEADLFDGWDNIHRDQEQPAPVELSGQFTAIRETFQATGSRRLVILGRAGSGKTVLAHRLILDLLDHRGPRGPVPVLFSLGDWNPTTTRLREWMITRLMRDFSSLEERDATGTPQAKALIDDDWILPVLDGFDELPDRHHHAAIRQISQVQLPLLLTSRPKEYADAVRATRAIGRAAAIEIDDLTLDEAERYLLRSAASNHVPAWTAVFAQLRTAPQQTASQNLTPVLTTPLMIMLARTHYEDGDKHDPGELLDTAQFPTSTHLQQHLLRRYIDTLYDPQRPKQPTQAARPAWTPDQARHWLGYLATRLHARDTHDFTWWQLPALIPRPTRILAVTTIFGLAFTLAGGLLFVLAIGIVFELPVVFPVVLAIGIAVGLAVRLLGWFAVGLLGVLAGLLTGLLAAVLAVRLLGVLEGVLLFLAVLTVVLVAGFSTWSVGLAIGIVNEAGFARGRAGFEPERLRLYRRRRRLPQRNSKRRHLTKAASEFANGFTGGLAIVLPVGLLLGLVFGLARGLAAGLLVGLTGGLMFGVVTGVLNVVVSVFGEGLDPHDSDPWDLLSTDRAVTLTRAISAGLVIASLMTALGLSVDMEPADIVSAAMSGPSTVLLLRLTPSAWGNWLLFTRVWLPLTGRLPWRPKRFLEDAHARGILRRAGAAYQFRHAQLRDHLAENHPGNPEPQSSNR